MQESLNSQLHLSTARQNEGDNVRIKLASTRNPKDYDYRYMYEKMMERSEGAPFETFSG